jgi:RNA polymerase sigma factor (sigma-70 family)
VVSKRTNGHLGRRTQRLIRARARGLQAQYGVTNSDAEDFEQELVCRVLEGKRRFDPQRSSPATFEDRQVRNAAIDIARRESAKCRDPSRRAYSLDEDICTEAGDPRQRHDLIYDDLLPDVQLAMLGDEGLDLRIDLGRALYRLPQRQRDLLKRISRAFQKGEASTLLSLSQALDIPRSTLYGHLKRLRLELYRIGIGDYASF